MRSLTPSKPAEWLGFRIEEDGGASRFFLADRAWERLGEWLALAQDDPDRAGDTRAMIAGWVSSLGPCYPSEDLDAAHGRLKRLASNAGGSGIPGRRRFKGLWQRAFARWCKLRTATVEWLAEQAEAETTDD